MESLRGHSHRRPERRISLASQDDSTDERVPSGIVGARIHQLMTTARREPSQTAVVDTVQRERANTTLGWGRRIDRSFAKPASRNTILLEEAPVHLPEHTFMGPVMERKNHRQEHGLTRRSVRDSARHDHRPLRHTASTTEVLQQTKRHKHDSLRPSDDHYVATYESARSTTSESESRNSSLLPTKASSEARSANTAARQRDALDLFEHYGISRPQG